MAIPLPLTEATPIATTATHCPYCALQCGLNVVADGPSAAVAARPEFPVNAGALCLKGWTATDLLSHPERLTTPLARSRSGALCPID